MILQLFHSRHALRQNVLHCHLFPQMVFTPADISVSDTRTQRLVFVFMLSRKVYLVSFEGDLIYSGFD
jgi:hypothetical protein